MELIASVGGSTGGEWSFFLLTKPSSFYYSCFSFFKGHDNTRKRRRVASTLGEGQGGGGFICYLSFTLSLPSQRLQLPAVASWRLVLFYSSYLVFYLVYPGARKKRFFINIRRAKSVLAVRHGMDPIMSSFLLHLLLFSLLLRPVSLPC